MKALAAATILTIMIWMTGCEITGSSIRVKGATVEIPGVGVGVEGGGKFCPPGQAQKGRC
ncbi:MAG: hypothetical protein D6704_12085 [Nitrospirae bacterium]|nr:MAG: hypothetical protein D6704_12085 [Nitrospirota bacterium]